MLKTPGKPDSLPARMVLLAHHDAPQGDHFDWMIQDGSDPTSPLRTWRVMVRLDELHRRDWFIAEELPAHRAAYLTFEGEVSGGRGRVKRVAAGRAAVIGDATGLNVVAAWDGGVRHEFFGCRVDANTWRFGVRDSQ